MYNSLRGSERTQRKEGRRTMKHENVTKMLISFFNMKVGTRYRATNRGEEFEQIILDDESNISDIRKAITEWVSNGGNDDITGFINWYKYERNNHVKEQKQEQVPMTDVNQGLSFITNVVSTMVAQMKTDEIQNKVASNLKEQIDQYILDTYGKIEKKVTLVSEFGRKELPGVQHKKFETVLKFVANDEPVYLAGPAGSGKNVICKQVADTLGLDFYFTNAVTQEYKLTGFTDANGIFHESQFYKAFVNGGVFMLDEMDASIPEVLIILNAAIANRYFDFPAPIGKVEANPNFRVIAAGNTFGYGADSSYVGRNTLDAASLDRFAVIEIDYDERIELNVTNNNKELVDFCHDFRKAVKKNGLMITISYRAMSRIAKMESLMDTKELILTCLVKGMEKDDLKMLRTKMTGSGKYHTAIDQIIRTAS